MKMKRFFTIGLIILVTGLLLAACGGATDTPADTDIAGETGDAEPADTTDDSAAEADEDAGSTETTDEDMAEDDSAADEEPAEETPQVLKVATTANITTWDPVASFSTEAFYMAQIYEQLLRVNPPDADERFTPLLAESWEPNEDGTVWTFNLREGVTFHDGEPLTAEAVKMSLDAAAERGGASFIWLPLDSIEVVDELTVQINLSYAAPVDLIASSLYGAWIVSPKALEAAAEDETYFQSGVAAGTGPYTLASYTPDSEIVLEAYDNYWGEQPYFDTVLNLIVPEDVQQQQMLEGGEVDLATRLPVDNIENFRDREGYEVIIEPSFFNYVGFFNTLRPPLDDPTVRQALSYAIPYEDIIQVGAQGLGTQSYGPVPAGVWPWSDDVDQYTYDLERAAELLAEAGYPNGEGFPELRLTYAAENATEERFAPLIKDSFAEIGVNVQIEPLLFNQQWEEAKTDPENAQDMFLLLYWPTYSDAGTDNLWSMFHSSDAPFFNLSYWVNEEFDTLIDEAAALTVSDPDTAQEKYIEAMNILVEEAPGLFFFDTQVALVIPDYIEGYQYNLNYPFVQFFFADLSVAE